MMKLSRWCRQSCHTSDWSGSRNWAPLPQWAVGAKGLHVTGFERTIADPSNPLRTGLEGAAEIKTHHLVEAIEYRPRRQV